ncbi:MAG: COX15/CtaA family protein [Gammaproteobacteria bacterium]|nr:COX15/CtaA family protein [Gammaproteobacteria bacterium]
MRNSFYTLARVGTVVCLCVVVLGAWVRLTDAGLGCPDWPGCYGVLTVPQSEDELLRAEQFRPDRAVDVGAAWREMIHRYLAGILGLMVLAMAVIAVLNRRDAQQPVVLPQALLVLIIFQSLLGMWTVTLLLKPLIVMLHLLGGLATLTLLFLLARMPRQQPRRPPAEKGLRRLAIAGLAVLVVQIALGGWTSTNYAALACPDFPKCQTQWWPDMDFSEGFVMWRGLGIDYEHGVLDGEANTAIHMTHRMGALVASAVLIWLAITAWRRSRDARVHTAAWLMSAALVAQLTIGILIVLLGLPLSLATAHNAMAALLLLAVVNLNITLRRAPAASTGG